MSLRVEVEEYLRRDLEAPVWILFHCFQSVRGTVARQCVESSWRELGL